MEKVFQMKLGMPLKKKLDFLPSVPSSPVHIEPNILAHESLQHVSQYFEESLPGFPGLFVSVPSFPTKESASQYPGERKDKQAPAFISEAVLVQTTATVQGWY